MGELQESLLQELKGTNKRTNQKKAGRHRQESKQSGISTHDVMIMAEPLQLQQQQKIPLQMKKRGRKPKTMLPDLALESAATPASTSTSNRGDFNLGSNGEISEEAIRAVLGKDYYEVEAIRQKRIRRGKLEYLVKWKNWPERENTWEPARNLRTCVEIIRDFDKSIGSPSSSGGGRRGKKRKKPVSISEKERHAETEGNVFVSPDAKRQKSALNGQESVHAEAVCEHAGPSLANEKESPNSLVWEDDDKLEKSRAPVVSEEKKLETIPCKDSLSLDAVSGGASQSLVPKTVDAGIVCSDGKGVGAEKDNPDDLKSEHHQSRASLEKEDIVQSDVQCTEKNASAVAMKDSAMKDHCQEEAEPEPGPEPEPTLFRLYNEIMPKIVEAKAQHLHGQKPQQDSGPEQKEPENQNFRKKLHRCDEQEQNKQLLNQRGKMKRHECAQERLQSLNQISGKKARKDCSHEPMQTPKQNSSNKKLQESDQDPMDCDVPHHIHAPTDNAQNLDRQNQRTEHKGGSSGWLDKCSENAQKSNDDCAAAMHEALNKGNVHSVMDMDLNKEIQETDATQDSDTDAAVIYNPVTDPKKGSAVADPLVLKNSPTCSPNKEIFASTRQTKESSGFPFPNTDLAGGQTNGGALILNTNNNNNTNSFSQGADHTATLEPQQLQLPEQKDRRQQGCRVSKQMMMMTVGNDDDDDDVVVDSSSCLDPLNRSSHGFRCPSPPPNNTGVTTTSAAGPHAAITHIHSAIKYAKHTSSAGSTDIRVTFRAQCADGQQVVVDNKYLRLNNPILLIDFYEQHLRYSS